MLSVEDNEALTRVGPGTVMGDLIRQYWVPALLSEELPEADSARCRLKLLGENLIAFRVTSGKVGIIDDACPHRGASLFFGRNEEEGLRCVYHGWKFDYRRPLPRHAEWAEEQQVRKEGPGRHLPLRRARRIGHGPIWVRASATPLPTSSRT